MFHSIRWRLVASFALLTLLTAVLISILALQIVQHSTAQQELDDLRASAQAVARQALPLFNPVPDQLELDRLARTTAFLSDTRVRILNRNGDPIADSGPAGESAQVFWFDSPTGFSGVEVQPGIEASLGAALNGQLQIFPGGHDKVRGDLPTGTYLTVVRRSDSPWGGRLTFETTIWNEGDAQSPLPTPVVSSRSGQVIREPIGDTAHPIGYVELSAWPDLSSGVRQTAQRALLLAGAGAVLLACLFGLWISRRLSDPLSELSAAAGKMGAGDLSARAPVRSQDEIGELAQQFNRMAERLQASFNQLSGERDALRRFVADASHELRTPITALRNFVTLLQGPAAADPPAQGEFLAESQLQLDRLEWVTTNLLDLSRMDAGLVELDLQECEVAELFETVRSPFRSRAEQKDISLEMQLDDEGMTVHADCARIQIALANLVDNALKFTQPGGQVVLGARRAEGGVQLWVSDNGPGIAPEHLSHVFERFYRGDGEESGSGLGLAIVHSLVQAHGGRVEAANNPDGGACITLEIPD